MPQALPPLSIKSNITSVQYSTMTTGRSSLTQQYPFRDQFVRWGSVEDCLPQLILYFLDKESQWISDLCTHMHLRFFQLITSSLQSWSNFVVLSSYEELYASHNISLPYPLRYYGLRDRFCPGVVQVASLDSWPCPHQKTRNVQHGAWLAHFQLHNFDQDRFGLSKRFRVSSYTSAEGFT